MSERIMLSVRGLKKSFGDLCVLDGINFDIRQGETVAVIGPSGSGKSTMLRCLIDLEKAQDG
ncbi:MAG: amino acid ABC transporter ATP-binding protein, partial [Clostridia bacterium]|nr:amino acid ABC transporter ATP-binding protein [Clostridia bacterium]